MQRATDTFWTLIPLAQFRLSLMSIFRLEDEISFGNTKAKKLRNQLRIAIDQIKADKDEIEAQKKEILEQKNEVLELKEKMTKLEN